jgi:hypothetical protein
MRERPDVAAAGAAYFATMMAIFSEYNDGETSSFRPRLPVMLRD